MLCSARELGLSEDASGLFDLPADLHAGQELIAALRLDDTIFEVNLTPNRGDCMSVAGVAREVAALRNAAAASAGDATRSTPTIDDNAFRCGSKAAAACPKFVGRVIRGMRPNAQSPFWMQERLRRAGLRPISADRRRHELRDARARRSRCTRTISTSCTARSSCASRKAGETLKLLDGRTIELTPDVLVIADERTALGLAGVMGGEDPASATRPPTCSSKARSSTAGDDRGPRPPLRTDHRCVAAFRARRRSGAAGARDRARDAVAARVRRRRRRVRSIVTRTARTLSGAARRFACVISASSTCSASRSMPTTVVDLLDAPRHESRGRLRREWQRHAAVVALRHSHRRRPDRGSRAAVRLRQHSRARRDRRADDARRGPRRACATSAPPICWSTAATRKRSPTRSPTGSASAAVSRSRRSRSRNPISAELGVMRVSLWPGLVQALREQSASTADARASVRSRSSLRGRHGAETEVIAGVATGSALPEQWDVEATNVDFFDVKADVEALLALTGAAQRISRSSPKRIRRCIPGSRRESGAATVPSAGSARCIRSISAASI